MEVKSVSRERLSSRAPHTRRSRCYVGACGDRSPASPEDLWPHMPYATEYKERRRSTIVPSPVRSKEEMIEVELVTGVTSSTCIISFSLPFPLLLHLL